jgi:hypothetical protein
VERATQDTVLVRPRPFFIGVSVGFGHSTLKWADAWAAHKFAGAPRPVKPRKGSRERARKEKVTSA